MNDNIMTFMNWMKTEGFLVSKKVEIVKKPQSNYSVIVNDDIQAHEVLFEIPRKSVLSVFNSNICRQLVQENVVQISRWGSLVLCVLHEICLGEESRWYHYLKMFPNFDDLRLPMFWTEKELALLKETDIRDRLLNDLELQKVDFETVIKPFIAKYPNLFLEDISIDTYKYYVAFIMAYSFTKCEEEEEDGDSEEENKQDESLPYFVPMADVLNHTSKNNAKLEYHENNLTMIATKFIKKGEEVFNTYGDLPNSQLLQQYGFCLPHEDTEDDVVEMNLSNIPNSMCTPIFAERLNEIRDFDSVILSKTGFLNTEELSSILSALHMGDSDFEIALEELTKEDEYEEVSEDVMTFSDYLTELELIKKVPQGWREVLSKLVGHTMAVKREALAVVNRESEVDKGRPSPRMFVSRLLEGHLYLLENVLRFL